MFKVIEYHGQTVVKFCEGKELFAAYHFFRNPNKFIIPIVRFNWEKRCYVMLRGITPTYTESELVPWLKKLYAYLKKINISHNDIMMQNIVRLPCGNYRLIDFEFVKYGGGSFHDWSMINQLIKRILNNTSSNKGEALNTVSFFRQ